MQVDIENSYDSYFFSKLYYYFLFYSCSIMTLYDDLSKLFIDKQ